MAPPLALPLLLLAMLLPTLPAGDAAGAGRGQSQNPLLDDSVRPHKPGGRAAECTFGKQMRELGSTWFADLGPPIGVMYCIRCECISIQKKRRIVARVQCRNIKHECPAPTCAEPVLLPNRCCKTCPGDDVHSPDVVQDVAPSVSAEEEDKNWKHFAALLSGRTSQAQAPGQAPGQAWPTQHVATARFTFQRRSLYFSVITAGAQRPRAIQFVDTEGNILEEQVVPAAGSLYQNATGKVCGVWRRLSRDYRRLLREDRLLVTLLWDQDDGVTGAIQRHRALGPGELLSALLVPASGSDATLMAGSGGTAIVSASSSAPVPTIQIALIFNGVFSPQDVSDVPVTVRLETADRSRTVLEEVIRVAKPSTEINEGSVAMTVSASDLRLLTRGKLVLTVESARRPGALALSGAVQPRATCELFQAPLSEASESEDAVASHAQGTGVATGGQAWLYVDRTGALVYNVQLLKVPGEDTLLTLVSGRGRRFVELEDLTPSLHREKSGAGWANGTLKLSPRELAQLYGGELAVNVATGSAASLVRGRLVAKLVADARDGAHPILLASPSSNVTGMAWVAIDQDCSLHYDISLSPVSFPASSPPAQLYLEQVPFVAPGAPVSRRILDEFSSTQHEGAAMGLTHADLSRIDAGVSYLDIKLPDGSGGLRGEFLSVKVPTVCLPHYSDNDVPFMSMSAGQSPAEPETLHCFHETRFYEDGAQWVSAQDPCTMCSCHRARVQCDPVVCPPPACPAALLAEPSPGHCCGSCRAPPPSPPPPPAPMTTTTAASTSSASLSPPSTVAPGGGHGCRLAGQFHEAGSSWHPYVPPNGFDTCAVCTCNASTLETRCLRLQCPPLGCAEQEAVRPDPRACCKQCPARTARPAPSAPTHTAPMLLAEQAVPKTVDEILAEGGCRNPLGKPHQNGDEWHPKISSHGEYKCVKCRCKDGKVKCDRKRCTRSVCEASAAAALSHAHSHHLSLRRDRDKEDACCSAQCRRFRRHPHPHHRPRDREPRSARSEPRR